MSAITFNGILTYDPTLFNEVVLPPGLNKDVLISTINMKSGDLLCYYHQPTHLKRLITNWFNVIYYSNIERMLRALNEEYNPIHNYERIETTTDINTHNDTTSMSSTSEGSSTNTNDVSAYNSSVYSPNTQSEAEGESSSSGSTSNSGGYTNTHTSNVSGNIGVTTNQQMLKDEMEIRLKYNIYDSIASAFEKEFLIQVY